MRERFKFAHYLLLNDLLLSKSLIAVSDTLYPEQTPRLH